MKSILFPIDGSGCALRALALFIKRQAEYRSAESIAVHLVNVQTPLPAYISYGVGQEQIDTLYQSEAEAALEDARALLDKAQIKYTSHIKIGDIAEEIVKLSESLGCDQILMGTRGKGAVGDWLMGSVTQKVLHLTKIPLLLVK